MITARDILESPVWQDAVKTLETQHWQEFSRLAPSDIDRLQDLAYRRAALALILRQISDRMESGRSINLKGKQ